MSETLTSQKTALQSQLSSITKENEFMKNQINLFSAFLWRYNQSNNFNDTDTTNEKENNSNSTLEISINDFNKLEKQISINTRLNICKIEKYLMKKEIESLKIKSESDISSLNCVLKQFETKIIDLKKEIYDFKRNIIIENNKNNKEINTNKSLKNFNNYELYDTYENLKNFKEIKTNINSEKLKKYLQNKIKCKKEIIQKYDLKNSNMLHKINELNNKLHKGQSSENNVETEELESKDDNNNNGNLDTFSLIDLEQLKIQNSQYNSTILYKNKELLKLKLKAGKAVQILNNLKFELNESTKNTKLLENELSEKQSIIHKLNDEINLIKTEYAKQNKYFIKMKSNLANTDFPKIMDYVKQKTLENNYKTKVQSLTRTVNIKENKLKLIKQTNTFS